MRTNLAHDIPPDMPRVLVLGEGLIHRRICDDLLRLGITPIQLIDLGEDLDLPHPLDPDARTMLGDIFLRFLETGDTSRWVHPGVSLWSERHDFEGIAESYGVQAIMPPPKAISLCTNTFNLLQKAQSLGIPNLIIADDPVFSIREAQDLLTKLDAAKKSTFPFILKSAYRVRGGYGTRVIRNQNDLEEWAPIWLEQVRERTGDGILFLERFLEGARCYVQPFARTASGEIEIFPLVDGSLQFEGKSWVDICPAQSADDHLFSRIEAYTTRLAEHVGYVGVGALVYYTDGVEVYLTEALPRLNYGYNLWEKIAHTSAVEWQVYCAAPELMSHSPKKGQGVAGKTLFGVNLKIYAEDPVLRLPHPGWVTEACAEFAEQDPLSDSELKWEVKTGDLVSWKSTGALGQLTVFSPTWKDMLASARHALRRVWISGTIQTNERFLDELLGHPWIEEGMFYAGFVDNEFIPRAAPPEGWIPLAVQLVEMLAGPNVTDQSWMWLNQKVVAPNTTPHWHFHQVESGPGNRNMVTGVLDAPGHTRCRVAVVPISETRWIVRLGQWFIPIRRAIKGKSPKLMALVTGSIHSVFVKEGSVVPARQNLLIIESLEQLVSHRLPLSVSVKNLSARPEDEVIVGQELAELERWEEKESRKTD